MKNTERWEEPEIEYPPLNIFTRLFSFIYFINRGYLPEWHRRRIEIGCGIKEMEELANATESD